MTLNFKKKILIATGGTGGHVFPAYSLARNLIKENYDINISTDKRGLRFLKDYSDLKLNVINSSTIFDKNLIYSLFSFFKIILAIFKSCYLIIKKKPEIVFGMGGYSSFPVCVAAKLLGIPFFIYENNLVIGKSNKYLLPFAKKMFVSNLLLKGIKNKYKYKVFEVGNIIRQEIIDYESKNEKKLDYLSFLVLGGSQAAQIFGDKLPKIFEECKKNKISIKIFQQCLPEQTEKLKNIYNQLNIENDIFNFKHNLSEYFSKINIAITRSGSSMLAELLNCNIPIICIPLSTSADNHQLENAKFIKDKGYGFIVEEQNIEKELFSLIDALHKDNEILDGIQKKQKKYSDQNVFKKIEIHINSLIND